MNWHLLPHRCCSKDNAHWMMQSFFFFFKIFDFNALILCPVCATERRVLIEINWSWSSWGFYIYFVMYIPSETYFLIQALQGNILLRGHPAGPRRKVAPFEVQSMDFVGMVFSCHVTFVEFLRYQYSLNCWNKPHLETTPLREWIRGYSKHLYYTSVIRKYPLSLPVDWFLLLAHYLC